MPARALAAVLGLGVGLTSPGHARAGAAEETPDYEAIVDALGGADLVLFDEPRPNQATRVVVAKRVHATAEWLRGLLAQPATYQRAIPSFRRAEVVQAQGTAALLRWELEIPLWNLAGRLWLRPRPDGAELDLVDGDLAPGLFRLWVQPGPIADCLGNPERVPEPSRDGLRRAEPACAPRDGSVLLRIEARANVRNANFMSRRLAKRSPFAEPAMTAAAAHVLLRALALEAERGTHAPLPRRWPKAAPAPPQWRTLDGTRLGGAALPLGAVAAAVHSRPDGRLARVEVAVHSKLPGDAVARATTEPQRWRALPGWKRIDPAPPPRGSIGPTTWIVDWSFPFIDFDAVWSVVPGPPLRALAVEGDSRGAVLGWDVVTSPDGTLVVFSMHPRLEKAGYVPRKLIEAEPLLEQGLSLGLAYVEAVSFVRALGP